MFDLADIIAVGNSLKVNKLPIIQTAVGHGLYKITNGSYKDTGKVGKCLQGLVEQKGLFINSKNPAILRTVSNNTDSDTTVCIFAEEELKLHFQQTKLRATLDVLGLYLTSPTKWEIEYNGKVMNDARVTDVVTFDLSDPVIYDEIKDDFDIYCRKRNPALLNNLIVDYRSDGKLQWRIRHHFVQSIIGKYYFDQAKMFSL